MCVQHRILEHGGALCAFLLVAALQSPVHSQQPACPAGPDSGVHGTVMEVQTGLPLPAATVYKAPIVQDRVGPDTSRIQPDGDGRYAFCGLAPGSLVAVWARAGGAETSRFGLWIPGDSLAMLDLALRLPAPGRLRGRAVDRASGGAVEGARLALPDLRVEALTDDHGEFEMPAVPGGRYRLQVDHVAYGRHRDSVTVEPAKTVRLSLVLEQQPVQLRPLEVTVEGVRATWLENTGFYRRMERAGGAFITREQIVDRDPERVSQLFKSIAGVRVRTDGNIAMLRAPRSLITGARCEIQYFVDGRRTRLPVGVDAYQPADIEAIEVYRGASEIPAFFDRGRAACGVVVLWMRVERN